MGSGNAKPPHHYLLTHKSSFNLKQEYRLGFPSLSVVINVLPLFTKQYSAPCNSGLFVLKKTCVLV